MELEIFVLFLLLLFFFGGGEGKKEKNRQVKRRLIGSESWDSSFEKVSG